MLPEETKTINMVLEHCSLWSISLANLVNDRFCLTCELETNCANK